MNGLTLVVTVASLLTMQHPAMPDGMSHEEHARQMAKDEALRKRGADAMGFDQLTTTHHFKLTSNGGSIEVTVNDAADAATLAQVRQHLKTIAAQFAHGDFERPHQTHAEVPPGVADMQQRVAVISYRYGDIRGGGAVRIRTADAQALSAVHAFLRYQITAHATGDPQEVKRQGRRR
jgi:hypothetical protein